MIIGIISDIHEDIVRLREALYLLERRKVDEIICLGDLVGYSVPFYTYLDSRNANEVVRLVRANCSEVVIGNHDLYAIRKIPRNRDFFDYDENWYQLDFRERKKKSSDRVFLYEDNELPHLLSSENLNYLMSLPEFVVKGCGDHNLLLTHYAFPDCTGSSTQVITASAQLKEHFYFMEMHGCIYGISGNDHHEGFRRFITNQVDDYVFGAITSLDEMAWVHGPTVSMGTFDNGIMIYDTKQRTLEAIALGSPKHYV